MIKKIRNWADKSSENRLCFVGLCIIACQLMWFIPLSIFEVMKYGWVKPIPLPYVLIQLGLILLSIWIGAKVAIRFLYGKEK